MSLDSSACVVEVDWPASSSIRAYYTTRKPAEVEQQNDSKGETKPEAYASFNLATHVGDEIEHVLNNRDKLSRILKLPSNPCWLEQTHSTELHQIQKQNKSLGEMPVADGSYTQLTDKVCCVMTADCLPVLLTNKEETWVAAVHAGWRGLADGILQQAISKSPGTSSDLIAWLGPAISRQYFEVGEEVRQQFLARDERMEKAFTELGRSKYLADLYFIAKTWLLDMGVEVYGGDFCTYRDYETFYSYRRDGVTGRMASFIWIDKVNSGERV